MSWGLETGCQTKRQNALDGLRKVEKTYRHDIELRHDIHAPDKTPIP
jgi:hypothetical protein